jgi:DNA-binding transcriptional regulator PaaX
MDSHFCKVGKVRPSIGEVWGLKELEEKYLSFIEEAYNVMQTDASLSDILYYEALKLKKHIVNFNMFEEQ